jgi:phosphopantothenoylcysteine decarboxylase/phosphopantothenate--cysteine ligase
MLTGKKIVLGVCGSIASYKAGHLVRLLLKAGAEVQVVMTKDAVSFITPLTLATLSKKPVLVDYFIPETGEWNNHVDLGLWADILLIAPASANTLGKMATGICDNLLLATYLSAKCPVYFAPAMDLDMWKHPSTVQNVKLLQSYGNILIQPNAGELASGLIGEGRMAEPEEIVALLQQELKKKLPLVGKKALVTAGPTYEAIDPVRFIGNHSSGKMGFAIAEELYRLGADVTLISGPTALSLSHKAIKRLDVVSADDLLKATVAEFSDADITVMSAAVADYKPEQIANQKIKKKEQAFSLNLIKTTDILAELGNKKRPNQLLVGFALETENEVAHASDKLKRKNLDLIVLNSLNDEGAGFKSDLNKITILDKQLNAETFVLKPKNEVAQDICQKILALVPHEKS